VHEFEGKYKINYNVCLKSFGGEYEDI